MIGYLFKMKILKKLQKNNDSLYKLLKQLYGNTVGMWFAKELYVKYIGFYNGKKRLKLLSEIESNKTIAKKIKSGKPFMIGRMGSSEVRGIFKNEFDCK